MSTASGSAARAAYRRLAPYYDALNDHPAYAGWILGLRDLAVAHGCRGHDLLDLACGTGRSFIPLLAEGYDVTGVDVAEEMLAAAHDKSKGAARLERYDLCSLPPLGSFSLAFCLNDALNYLLAPEELGRALRRIRGNLHPGSVLVFDTNTIATFREVLSSHRLERRGALIVEYSGRASGPIVAGGTTETLISIIDHGNGRGSRVESRHLQRHHPQELVRAALRQAGLAIAGVYGQHDDGRRDDTVDEDRHTKVVWVARPAF